MSDKLPANLGYLYENLVAQMITFLPLYLTPFLMENNKLISKIFHIPQAF